jgi:hydroxypyruvate reductase
LPLAAKMSGKRLGILGLGHVGRAVARRAEGFGMRIAYYDRHPVAGAAYRFQSDLEQLAKDSDFLVVAASSGPATRDLVSRPVLDALGPTGVLINVARGSVVDEPALVAALAEGRLDGGRPRRLCTRAGRSEGALGQGQCRAAAASGERDGRDTPGHGRPRPR